MGVRTRRLSWRRPDGRPPCGLFVTDLDGTLLRSDRTFGGEDLAALKRLERMGIVRVVATGRSMYSFKTVEVSRLTVDYVIFSTGAGVVEWPSGRIVRERSLSPEEVVHICGVLKGAGVDFMVLRQIPDTHRFAFFSVDGNNADFNRRLKVYDGYGVPLTDGGRAFGAATQALVIAPAAEGTGRLAQVRAALPEFSIIQTTSPLDGQSTWIEIFPTGISKSDTAAWLAGEMGILRRDTLSVGNDYNDLDLLEWAGTSFVVANAPAELQKRFPSVASNNEGGVAEAVDRWLKQMGG